MIYDEEVLKTLQENFDEFYEGFKSFQEGMARLNLSLMTPYSSQEDYHPDMRMEYELEQLKEENEALEEENEILRCKLNDIYDFVDAATNEH